MSTDTAVSGKVINVTIDSTSFALVEEGSVSFDAGESTTDFSKAATMVSETFTEVASPTLEFTTAVENAAAEGLSAAGIVDADGNYQVSGSRRVSSVTVEYLDAESGNVELTLNIPSATVEFSGLENQNPVTYDITLHINKEPTLTPPSSGA